MSVSDCVVCLKDKPGCSVEVRAARGVSHGSPGEEAEWAFVCDDCQQKDEDRQYEYDESLYEERWWPEVAL